MNPIQPFFALSTDHYYKNTINHFGISHIYGFHCQDPLKDSPSILPDGCIDIVFDLSAEKPDALVCGSVSVSENSKAVCQTGHDYLGIRFLPGYVPHFLDGSLADFVDNEIHLADCSTDAFLEEKILTADDPARQAAWLVKASALSEDSSIPEAAGISNSQSALIASVRRMINDSHGLMRVQDMETETGYSRRYINKIFHAYMGFSPKKMSQIIRFQSVLGELTHNASVSFSDLALKYGYYDQSQFNRDFKNNLHTTPRIYRKTLLTTHYMDHFFTV